VCVCKVFTMYEVSMFVSMYSASVSVCM
jgi:hypothetical protein